MRLSAKNRARILPFLLLLPLVQATPAPAGQGTADEVQALLGQLGGVGCQESARVRGQPFQSCGFRRQLLGRAVVAVQEEPKKFVPMMNDFRRQLEAYSAADGGPHCAVGVLWEQARAARYAALGSASFNARLAKQIQDEIEASLAANPATPSRPAAVEEQRALQAAAAAVAKFLNARIEEEKPAFADWRGKREALARKYGCVEERMLLEEKARRGSVLVSQVPAKSEEGSGSYVRTVGAGGGAHYAFLTAFHVPALDLEDPESLRLTPSHVVDSVKADGAEDPLRGAVDTLEMEALPGRFDRGNDVISKEVPPRENTLAVVDSQRLPELGQEFFVTGHPTIDGREFALRSCTFLGYGPRETGGEGAYYLRCPSVFGVMGGNSGGAVVDKDGVVWGVHSAQMREDLSMLLASPVSQDAKGKLLSGVQRTFTSDHCFNNETRAEYRCRIVPGVGFSSPSP